MLKIRLSRAGKKWMPFYKIVLTEHTKSPKHGYMEVLGSYNPLTKEVILNEADVKKHVANWVQLSETVTKIMARNSK